jgi:hypothetical protein
VPVILIPYVIPGSEESLTRKPDEFEILRFAQNDSGNSVKNRLFIDIKKYF